MKIFVASHKDFEMPVNSKLYQPLWVGSSGKENIPEYFQRDDEGDNISAKNSHYCELTGQYWIWKNCAEDIVGLCHYRRYFVTSIGKFQNLFFHKNSGFLNETQVYQMLQTHDIIRHNATIFPQGVANQYIQNHGSEDLKIIREAISNKSPEFIPAFDKTMNGKIIHLVNMIIATKEIFDEYCTWLFDILEEYEQKAGMTEKNKRAMGFLGEELLDVWILGKSLNAKDCFTINTERIDCKFLG